MELIKKKTVSVVIKEKYLYRWNGNSVMWKCSIKQAGGVADEKM